MLRLSVSRAVWRSPVAMPILCYNGSLMVATPDRRYR
jgi:hypothetical protein